MKNQTKYDSFLDEDLKNIDNDLNIGADRKRKLKNNVLSKIDQLSTQNSKWNSFRYVLSIAVFAVSILIGFMLFSDTLVDNNETTHDPNRSNQVSGERDSIVQNSGDALNNLQVVYIAVIIILLISLLAIFLTKVNVIKDMQDPDKAYYLVFSKRLKVSKQSINKLKNVLLVCLAIGFIFSAQQLNQAHTENQREYESLLNRFYIELSPTIDNVETLLAEKDLDEETYTRTLTNLEIRLSKLYSYLDLGDATLNVNIQEQPSFAQYADYSDLSDKEKNYFEGLHEVLTLVEKEMYSEETGQEDSTLTPDEFNEIIDKGTKLYEEEIQE